METRAIAVGVAVEWLVVSGTFLVAAVDRALARRRADAAVAAARGKEGKRLIHQTLRGDKLAPLCGAQAMWGWSRRVPRGHKPCQRCASKAARL